MRQTIQDRFVPKIMLRHFLSKKKYAYGRRFDPPVRQHSFVEVGHEILATAILSLPLIQEGQLSVTDEGCALRLGY